MALVALATLLLLSLHLATATPPTTACGAGRLDQAWEAAILHLAEEAGVVPDRTRSMSLELTALMQPKNVSYFHSIRDSH